MKVVTAWRCRIAGAVIAARVADGRAVPAMFRRHRSACLRCAATEARARAVARELRTMAGRAEPVPADLEYRVMAGIGEPVPVAAGRRPSPLAPVAATVAAAAAAAALVALRRRLVPQA